jgi:hypothetical protein
MTTSVIIKNVRLSYLYAFKPRKNDKGVESYQAKLIIPKGHPQLPEIRAAIQKERDTKWPDPKTRPNGLKNPLRDADAEAAANGKEVDPECENAFFLNANRYAAEQGAPTLVDASLKPVTDPGRWNSGDYANVKVDFFPYAKTENKGIGVGLVTIMFLRKGEPLTGRTDPMEGFEPVTEEEQIAPQTKAAADFWN